MTWKQSSLYQYRWKYLTFLNALANVSWENAAQIFTVLTSYDLKGLSSSIFYLKGVAYYFLPESPDFLEILRGWARRLRRMERVRRLRRPPVPVDAAADAAVDAGE